MKRIIALLLTLILVISLCACSNEKLVTPFPKKTKNMLVQHGSVILRNLHTTTIATCILSDFCPMEKLSGKRVTIIVTYTH